MRSTLGHTDFPGCNLNANELIESRRFSAFKERIAKGKKVTDEMWMLMEKDVGEHMLPLDTRFILCSHPRVNGQGYTAIRITLLKRIAESSHLSAKFAKAELLRRGHTDIPIEISDHAIDSASSRYWKVWVQKRRAQQGILSWLKEEAVKAYRDGVPVEDNVLIREYQGMTFCFQAKKRTLKLVTVS